MSLVLLFFLLYSLARSIWIHRSLHFADDLVCSRGDLTQLCLLLTSVKTNSMGEELLNILSNNATTVFAPNDNGMEAIVDGIDLLSIDVIVNLLSYHVMLDEQILEMDFECNEHLEMINGRKTATRCEKQYEKTKKTFQVGDGNTGDLPQIIDTDIFTCVGVIHIVNQVILPK